MLEVDWVSAAAMVSAVCAVIAAAVSVWVWRQLRASDLVERIAEGDAAVKQHADLALEAIRSSVAAVGASLGDVAETIARIETHQAADQAHVLRPRDLAAIQEKINRVSEDLAATRAQTTTQTQMLGEQLRLLQRLVQDNLAASRRSR